VGGVVGVVPPSPHAASRSTAAARLRGAITVLSPLEDVRACAEQGDAEAQCDLGTLYAGGEGVPEDHVLAYMWFNLATAQENEDAESDKARIEQHMTREQIDEAQRMSTEWIEAHPPGGN